MKKKKKKTVELLIKNLRVTFPEIRVRRNSACAEGRILVEAILADCDLKGCINSAIDAQRYCFDLWRYRNV